MMETESPFLWIGGLTGLDWVNTERIRQGQVVDLIQNGGDLLAWMTEAKLLKTQERTLILDEWRQHPEQEQETLTAVRAFRAIARQAAQEIVDSGTVAPVTVDRINERLRLRSGSYQLQAREQGGFAAIFVEQTTSTVSSLVGRLAQTVEEMLCHADLSLIRRCENDRCILFFYDTTKNHTRRWCSMAGCGNRAKAAAHYQRKRQAVESSQ